MRDFDYVVMKNEGRRVLVVTGKRLLRFPRTLSFVHVKRTSSSQSCRQRRHEPHLLLARLRLTVRDEHPACVDWG
jgi:hypothetical protein